jgi:phosphatidylserine/phosphatidylglycerophosphate/cardiolipin synthase-like enzyme
MENGFSNMANRSHSKVLGRRWLAKHVAAAFLLIAAGASSASAQEVVLFPAVDNAQAAILQKIKNENVRLDIALWFLVDGEITQAIINRHNAGLPVRVLGDRVGIFETDVNTKNSFLQLANAGVPIRVRYHPTWFPEIMHWKCGIFVGQNVVEFGSANWTTFELLPWSATNFKDETAMFTNDPALVKAFLTQFDKMWVDTTTFHDWPTAYKLEIGSDWTVPMNISKVRLEPDYPTNVPGMGWGQGSELHNVMIQEINAETQAVDVVSYRMTVPNLTDALIAKHQAGVPVRVFIEPMQYRNSGYPEYWLVGTMTDKLWVAGVPIKQRTHQGLTHMKTLITSKVALIASSNFTKNWQRDHNYFISSTTKPQLYQSVKDRFNAMWNDTTNYTTFKPLRPEHAKMVQPANGAVATPNPPTLEWKRTPWAVAFDVYLGKANAGLAFVGRVNAVLNEDPPETYSFTPGPLEPSTTYNWRIVTRTLATEKDPTLTAASELWSFTTAAGGGGGGSGPFTGTPVALPGTIQAEDFDNGGLGVAYHDTTSGNNGAQYRATDVDIEATTDTGGGFNIGWMAAGEWLKYSVDVTAAGTHTLEFRVASTSGGATFHLEVGGVDKTGPLTIPATGAWQAWTAVTKTGVSLAAGTQVWRLVIDSAGPTGSVGNLNYIRVLPGSGDPPPPPPPPPSSTPFGGTAVGLPGTIQLENFDEGGSGVAYFDTTAGNLGGQYRSTDVDIEVTSDTGGGYNLAWVKPGEWLKYTVNVSAAGTYNLEFRVAASANGGTFHLEIGGVDKTGPMTVPNTGGNQAWTTLMRSGVTLAAGPQVWRLVIDSAGTKVGNFNHIRVVPPSGVAGSTPYLGAPVTLPGTVQAENFDNGDAGVAYHDLTPGNIGGDYRVTDVDIEFNSDSGGGYSIGWVAAGEWLKYTVNVSTTKVYDIEVRVASVGGGGTFHVEIDGVDVTGPLTIPDTGDWQNWTTVRKKAVNLTSGTRVMRLVMDTNNAITGAVGNFNWIKVLTPK